MRTRRMLGTVATTLAVLAATGCGGESADPVAWSNDVCGALLPFVEGVANAQPDLNPSDPTAAVTGLQNFLDAAVTGAQASLTDLEDTPPSPVEGGDEFVTNLRSALTQFRDGLEMARSELEGVDPANPQSVAAALPAALTALQGLENVPNPAAGLESNPELQAAGEEAPNCQTIERTTGG
jgi:hypothetical protein